MWNGEKEVVLNGDERVRRWLEMEGRRRMVIPVLDMGERDGVVAFEGGEILV